jgi:hypothetical protein
LEDDPEFDFREGFISNGMDYHFKTEISGSELHMTSDMLKN